MGVMNLACKTTAERCVSTELRAKVGRRYFVGVSLEFLRVTKAPLALPLLSTLIILLFHPLVTHWSFRRRKERRWISSY
jgi:hypothetical protein